MPSDPEFFAAVFLATLGLAAPGAFIAPRLWRRWRRQRVLRQAFAPHWRALLRQHWPLYAELPPDVQQQLRQRTQVLLAEVPFVGCAGLVVTEPMRVLVAAQAALLLLGRESVDDWHFQGLSQVLLYPGPFVVAREQLQADGTVQATRQALAGESHALGQLVLSWQDVLEGAAHASDGRNVVLHEFAHRLDQAHGPANGAPELRGRLRQQRWAAAFSAEFATLRRTIEQDSNRPTESRTPRLIDDYAATAPAEFFAVTSELFFERPADLALAHPEIHTQLRDFYGVDPRHWLHTRVLARGSAAVPAIRTGECGHSGPLASAGFSN